MQDYEISYYYLNVEGRRMGGTQLRVFQAQEEEEAKTRLVEDFNDLLEIYEQLNPGVRSIEICTVKKQEVENLAKGIRGYLKRERELDEIKRRSMTDSDIEKELRDFISEDGKI